MAEEILPVYIAQAEVFAEHQLAVVEFDGVGVTRFGQRYDIGARREIGEDRMDIRRTKNTDIGDRRAVGVERVGHDRSVAAEFDHLLHHFEIRAQSGRGRDLAAEFPHALESRVFFRALAGRDHMKDRIHETVEADQAGGLRQSVGAGRQKIGRCGGQRCITHETGHNKTATRANARDFRPTQKELSLRGALRFICGSSRSLSSIG